MFRQTLQAGTVLLALALTGCGGPAAPMPTLASLPTNPPPTIQPTAAPTQAATATTRPTAAATKAATSQVSRTATTNADPKSPTDSSDSSSDTAGANSGTVEREKADCLRIREVFRAIKPDDTVQFPADFPPPPPNSTECGVDAPGNMHYANDMAPNAVIAYYKGKLAARGCTDPREEMPRPGEPALTMKCKDGVAAVATSAYLTEFLVRLTAPKK